MTPSLESINRELRVLDDAHRLGRIRRDDYRARRRRLLAKLCDSDGATARKPLVPQSTAVPAAHSLPSANTDSQTSANAAPQASGGRLSLILAGLGIVILALLLVWRLQAPSNRTSGGTAAAAVPATAVSGADQQAERINTLAQNFLRADQWDAANIDAFLKIWNSMDAGARNRGSQMPAVQSLRDQTRSKQRAVALLLDDDNTNVQRKAQSHALQKLDEALKGSQ